MYCHPAGIVMEDYKEMGREEDEGEGMSSPTRGPFLIVGIGLGLVRR